MRDAATPALPAAPTRAAPAAERAVASAPARRRSRPRLALEIAVALAVKLFLLYVNWATWFAHPASRTLDERGVAAAVLGVPAGAPRPSETPR
jgi:hypothetical protein